MSINNNTVGTTEITPVETEVTRSEKQESATLVVGGSNFIRIHNQRTARVNLDQWAEDHTTRAAARG